MKFLQLILWMTRGNEKDALNLYHSFMPIVKLANGGYTLNRGYWDSNTTNPLEAQTELCKLIGKFGNFSSAKLLVDIGSGLSDPALYWKETYDFINIICLDINIKLLMTALNKSRNIIKDNTNGRISFVNATGAALPFANNSVSRIISLETIQFFKPLLLIIQECKRVLEPSGIFVIATPIKKAKKASIIADLTNFGILSLILSSENYVKDYLLSVIRDSGFAVEVLYIGKQVFEHAADYYIRNRNGLREKIGNQYRSLIEAMLYRSTVKTKDTYRSGLIDYVLIRCKKADFK